MRSEPPVEVRASETGTGRERPRVPYCPSDEGGGLALKAGE